MNNDNKTNTPAQTLNDNNVPAKEQTSNNGNQKDKHKKGKKNNSNEKKRHTRQDPFFYAESEDVIRQCGTLTWLDIVGSEIGHTRTSIPAMMSIPYAHVIGNTIVGRDSKVLTRSANAFFQYLAQGYTGTITDFEAPDLFMIEGASASLCALIEEGIRVFGMSQRYSVVNSYQPRAMIAALGFHPDDFVNMTRESRADFVANLNIRIKQFNDSISLPKKYRLAQRWAYVASNAFIDNDQADYNTAIAYVLTDVLQFDGTHPTGSSLKWRNIRTHGASNNDWTLVRTNRYFEILDELLSKLTSTDASRMFYSIKRVYTPNDLVELPLLTMDYSVTPVRNDVVSAAIHNGDYYLDIAAVSDLSDGVDTIVWQTADGEVHSAVQAQHEPASNGRCPLVMASFLDTFAINPTPGNVLDMIAGMTTYSTQIGTDNTWIGVYARSELCMYPYIFYWDEDAPEGVGYTAIYTVIESGSPKDKFSHSLSRFTTINSHPFIHYYSVVGSEGSYGYDEVVMGEVDKYTSDISGKLGLIFDRNMFYMVEMPKNTKSVTSKT